MLVFLMTNSILSLKLLAILLSIRYLLVKFEAPSYYLVYKFQMVKGVCALRGYFGPLWNQKLNVAFHQFYPIGLLEE